MLARTILMKRSGLAWPEGDEQALHVGAERAAVTQFPGQETFVAFLMVEPRSQLQFPIDGRDAG
jgi:hypothetical protein